MTEAQFHEQIKNYLYELTGITLGDSKEVMINNRLQKLRRELDLQEGDEALLETIRSGKIDTEFINAFTTNKTNFFREGFHFDDLRTRVLPELFEKNQEFKIYCSASSTGEEPYSIAITTLLAQSENNKRNANYRIIATDIDTQVLAKAREGVYAFDPAKSDFPDWVSPQTYFKRRANGSEYLIKAKDFVKETLTFAEMNLMGAQYPFAANEFDVIFCRNVLIYFTLEDQNKILKRLFSHLKLGGTLYLGGHSENPLDLHPYVKRIGHNIFIKMKELQS